MLKLFSDNLLPVLLAAAVGYLVSARLKLDPKPLSRAAFYVFAPCLVYQIIVGNHVRSDAVLRMGAFAVACLLGLALVAGTIARVAGWSRPVVAAVVLVVLLPNTGNFGLAANRFAFGEAGLAQAGVFFVTSSILTFTVGVLVASMGRATLREAAGKLVRVPAVWSVLTGLIVVRLDWSLPFPVGRTVELLSGASIPVFLVVLGMQLYGSGVRGPVGPLVVAAAVRLVGGGVAGLALASLFGLEGPARQAGVLQSAMPSAVICTVLATEYELEPAFVTSAVLTTTLASPLGLTPLLALLG